MAPFGKSSREIIIRTERWEQAIAFYRSVLNLPLTHEGKTILGFETGSFCLYVEKGADHGPVFEFLVSDIQATKKHLVQAGCSVVEEDPSVPRCYIRDPFGLVFNIGKDPKAK